MSFAIDAKKESRNEGRRRIGQIVPFLAVGFLTAMFPDPALGQRHGVFLRIADFRTGDMEDGIKELILAALF